MFSLVHAKVLLNDLKKKREKRNICCRPGENVLLVRPNALHLANADKRFIRWQILDYKNVSNVITSESIQFSLEFILFYGYFRQSHQFTILHMSIDNEFDVLLLFSLLAITSGTIKWLEFFWCVSAAVAKTY